jgi:hypothetical protein
MTGIIRDGQGVGRARTDGRYELDLYYAREYLRNQGGAGGF